MKIIDVHCHIDWFSCEDLDIIAHEVDEIYAVSTGYKSALKLLSISDKYPNIKIAMGIHPEYFENYDDFFNLRELIISNRNKLYAIGEVGLAYFSLIDKSAEEQKELYAQSIDLLEKFILLAKDLNLPLVLHATESSSIDAYNLLKKHNIKKALFHWLNCDKETAKKIFKAGYFASVSLDILYNSRYFNFVKDIPLKNILIESDSPWKYDDNYSRPKDIINVIELVAKSKNMSINTFIKIINKNLLNFL